MPKLCVTAYGCLEGIWLPTLEHCCLSSTAYIDDSHYLDIISNNAVIINVHLCSRSEHDNMAPIIDKRPFPIQDETTSPFNTWLPQVTLQRTAVS
jgi:hypothetical protein